jgi:hypothetical protein
VNSGYNNVGNSNTYLGYYSGFAATGSNNVFIGNCAGVGVSLAGYCSSIAIGSCAVVSSNNQLSIASTTNWIGTASTATAGGLAPVNVYEYLCITVNGQARKIALYAV